MQSAEIDKELTDTQTSSDISNCPKFLTSLSSFPIIRNHNYYNSIIIAKINTTVKIRNQAI